LIKAYIRLLGQGGHIRGSGLEASQNFLIEIHIQPIPICAKKSTWQIFVIAIDLYENIRRMLFMNTIERLNRHAASRGFFARVARLSGLSRDTVVRIAKGITPNPGVNTLRAIDEGLDQYEADCPSFESSPDTPSWIVHDERTGLLTCTSCGTPIAASPDTPAGRDFVDVHSRCPDPYPAMRGKGRQQVGDEVGA
jgi:transcriptional regulator with XRE-family HTH domain